MSIIEVKKLSKDFKVKTKEKGFKGSIKSMFKPKYKIVHAVKNINLNIEINKIDDTKLLNLKAEFLPKTWTIQKNK